MTVALDVLAEAAERYGVTVLSATVTPCRIGVAKITVTGEGELSGTEKASLLKTTLIGVTLPGIGTVAGVRLQVTSSAWAVAELDLEPEPINRKARKIARSPFGGPLKLNGRQFTWLYKRGFPVPGVPNYRYDHVPYQAPGRK